MTNDWPQKDPRWRTYDLLAHYAPEVAGAAERMAALPTALRTEFRERLLAADDPVAAAPRIAADIARRHDRALNPLDNQAANARLRHLRAAHGDAAAEEFIAVIRLLGRSADPEAVARRVGERFQGRRSDPAQAQRGLRRWWKDGGDRITLAALAIIVTCAAAVLVGQHLQRAIQAGTQPAHAATIGG